jgi:hypothetical protein
METGLTRNQIFSTLARSEHGELNAYTKDVQRAFKDEPEFSAHLISWNRTNGQIRDAQIALPVVSLTVPGLDAELVENSLAHIAKLGLRELLKAYRFALGLKPRPSMRPIRRIIEERLRTIEKSKHEWTAVAVQHRHTMKELYALTRTKPADFADEILFKEKYPEKSVFQAIATLKTMAADDIAEAIVKFQIPFLVANGALGSKLKDENVALALIKAMTATELVTNMKLLEKMGCKTNPVLRAALEEGLVKVATSKKNVLKTTRAAEAMEDEGLKQKLRGAQERQIQNMKGVDGNWLVIGDCSGSMSEAIATANQISGTLVKMVKGKVHLVFVNSAPQGMDVSGLALDEIQKKTRLIRAGGGTDLSVGLRWALEKGLEIDGIVVVSDGADHGHKFPAVYVQLTTKLGKEIPVYLYECDGESNSLTRDMQAAKFDLQVFNLRGTKLDYYSLPNLVATMRTNRYSLADEVLEAPLLKLSTTIKKGKEKAHDHATA